VRPGLIAFALGAVAAIVLAAAAGLPLAPAAVGGGLVNAAGAGVLSRRRR
jgi:hypothetical protein